eukprot:TRINITY_DN1531_c0_g1_i5.p1 TRINITY_DN1531_c0_g1~~TRINITY_DN1531_c0_g1_i5.p1  ORF type:complete len:1200 (+),score=199.16 TRINITY_DN1531_c0_g1_i5:61-3600(+)
MGCNASRCLRLLNPHSSATHVQLEEDLEDLEGVLPQHQTRESLPRDEPPASIYGWRVAVDVLTAAVRGRVVSRVAPEAEPDSKMPVAPADVESDGMGDVVDIEHPKAEAAESTPGDLEGDSEAHQGGQGSATTTRRAWSDTFGHISRAGNDLVTDFCRDKESSHTPSPEPAEPEHLCVSPRRPQIASAEAAVPTPESAAIDLLDVPASPAFTQGAMIAPGVNPVQAQARATPPQAAPLPLHAPTAVQSCESTALGLLDVPASPAFTQGAMIAPGVNPVQTQARATPPQAAPLPLHAPTAVQSCESTALGLLDVPASPAFTQGAMIAPGVNPVQTQARATPPQAAPLPLHAPTAVQPCESAALGLLEVPASPAFTQGAMIAPGVNPVQTQARATPPESAPVPLHAPTPVRPCEIPSRLEESLSLPELEPLPEQTGGSICLQESSSCEVQSRQPEEAVCDEQSQSQEREGAEDSDDWTGAVVFSWQDDAGDEAAARMHHLLVAKTSARTEDAQPATPSRKVPPLQKIGRDITLQSYKGSSLTPGSVTNRDADGVSCIDVQNSESSPARAFQTFQALERKVDHRKAQYAPSDFTPPKRSMSRPKVPQEAPKCIHIDSGIPDVSQGGNLIKRSQLNSGEYMDRTTQTGSRDFEDPAALFFSSRLSRRRNADSEITAPCTDRLQSFQRLEPPQDEGSCINHIPKRQPGKLIEKKEPVQPFSDNFRSGFSQAGAARVREPNASGKSDAFDCCADDSSPQAVSSAGHFQRKQKLMQHSSLQDKDSFLCFMDSPSRQNDMQAEAATVPVRWSPNSSRQNGPSKNDDDDPFGCLVDRSSQRDDSQAKAGSSVRRRRRNLSQKIPLEGKDPFDCFVDSLKEKEVAEAGQTTVHMPSRTKLLRQNTLEEQEGPIEGLADVVSQPDGIEAGTTSYVRRKPKLLRKTSIQEKHALDWFANISPQPDDAKTGLLREEPLEEPEPEFTHSLMDGPAPLGKVRVGANMVQDFDTSSVQDGRPSDGLKRSPFRSHLDLTSPSPAFLRRRAASSQSSEEQGSAASCVEIESSDQELQDMVLQKRKTTRRRQRRTRDGLESESQSSQACQHSVPAGHRSPHAPASGQNGRKPRIGRVGSPCLELFRDSPSASESNLPAARKQGQTVSSPDEGDLVDQLDAVMWDLWAPVRAPTNRFLA